MAKVVTALPRKCSEAMTYNWDTWLDGQIWKLEEGTDFKVNTSQFRCQALSYAKRKKIEITTRIVGNCVYIKAKK